MKNAALAGGHGRKGEGAAGGTDFFDRDFSHQVEFAVAGGFEAFGVEGDPVVLFGFEAEDLCGDVLDGVEEFAVAGEQERSIGSGEFDCDLGGSWGGVWIGGGRLGCTCGLAGVGLHLAVAGKDVRLQVQAAWFVQNLQEVCDLSCGLARVVQRIRHDCGKGLWFCFIE